MPRGFARTVGSRELKTRLGTYLRRVREGATLIVTERGRPVAELRPLGAGGGTADEVREKFDQLVGVGLVSRELPEANGLPDIQPLASRPGDSGERPRTAGAAIVDDREDRF
ncbi:MAG TPA: type II toxin-antitoxin system prevent-host-death family antitoxin [Thermoanaerobaculia bacterium]|nr:type II toxin-antitoxin system prevent-host-death family antitoxin [Thermoanaerobaculia bacterium]